MKLERISPNQLRYSITFEELSVRGFIEEEMMKESFIWDELFDEMLDEASKIFELEECESVAIEIFSLTSKELVLILTLEEEDIDSLEKYKESEDPSSPKEEILFRFADIEDCIALSKILSRLQPDDLESSLFYMKDNYYLVIVMKTINHLGIECICQEYGDSTIITNDYLGEYGKLIIKSQAIPTLRKYF